MSYLLFLSLELNLLLLLSDEGDEGRDFELDRALSTLVGDWGGGGAAASWAGVLGAGAGAVWAESWGRTGAGWCSVGGMLVLGWGAAELLSSA